MIFWSGFGIFAGVIPVLCYMGFVKVCQNAYGVPYTDSHGWPGAVGTLIGAAAVWVLAQRMNGSARTLVDTATGETVVLKKNRHTLFFIPMEYWSYILVVVAMWMLFVKHKSDL